MRKTSRKPPGWLASYLVGKLGPQNLQSQWKNETECIVFFCNISCQYIGRYISCTWLGGRANTCTMARFSVARRRVRSRCCHRRSWNVVSQKPTNAPVPNSAERYLSTNCQSIVCLLEIFIFWFCFLFIKTGPHGGENFICLLPLQVTPKLLWTLPEILFQRSSQKGPFGFLIFCKYLTHFLLFFKIESRRNFKPHTLKSPPYYFKPLLNFHPKWS